MNKAMNMKPANLVSTQCPVCSHYVATTFFEGGEQPLATLAWPRTALLAQALPHHPHDFVQCPSCTHVWNHSFRYDAIPYENNPNRMYNSGGIWRGHLADTRDVLLAKLPAKPTVLEIGCGEGHFIRGLSESRPGRYVGFDPNTSGETGHGVEFYARLFDPLKDMAAFAPDAVVIRHVLEHLTEPAALLEPLAWGAAALGKPCRLFAEVPCIDRVFETGRLADFFYEHVSHFTTDSFKTLMRRTGEMEVVSHGYNGEVVYASVLLNVSAARQQQSVKSATFAVDAQASRVAIGKQMDELAASGKKVAIWGGTGKAAAFIHQFGADAKRFPLVVDSDPDKVGTFVPGTGQAIQFRDALKTNPAEVVIIPTQWRAKDIVAEMARESIHAEQVLIEHEGGLVDFNRGQHPYR
jgi:hypothetical protein